MEGYWLLKSQALGRVAPGLVLPGKWPQKVDMYSLHTLVVGSTLLRIV